jgi:hypothetical protein
VVPGAGDTAIFGTPGANTSCVLTAAVGVYDVDMTADYTATLTVATGGSLAASAIFTQNGTLALTGGAVSTTGGAF